MLENNIKSKNSRTKQSDSVVSQCAVIAVQCNLKVFCSWAPPTAAESLKVMESYRVLNEASPPLKRL